MIQRQGCDSFFRTLFRFTRRVKLFQTYDSTFFLIVLHSIVHLCLDINVQWNEEQLKKK